MVRLDDIVAQMRRNPKELRFADACRVCDHYFGEARQKGSSHRVYKTPYTYRVTWSEDDQEYVGRCAEFPSLSWLSSSPEAALRGIRGVVDGVAADMEKSHEPVPEPLAGRKFSGKFMVRVPRMCTVNWRSKRPKRASASTVWQP